MKKNRGMTLFIAVVIMSILLFISFAVVNIVLKGTLFASLGRDSQYAFYAADAGIECAIYWDTKFDPSKFDPSTSSNITCANQTSSVGGGGGNLTSTFSFNMNQGDNALPYCAVVTVTKNIDGTTKIYSRGYNTCDTSNPRRVERGLEVDY